MASAAQIQQDPKPANSSCQLLETFGKEGPSLECEICRARVCGRWAAEAHAVSTSHTQFFDVSDEVTTHLSPQQTSVKTAESAGFDFWELFPALIENAHSPTEILTRGLELEEEEEEIMSKLGSFGTDVVQGIETFSELARVFHKKGKAGEAASLYTRVLGKAELSLGYESLYTLGALLSLAELLQGASKYAEAERKYRRVLWMFQRYPEMEDDDMIELRARRNLEALLLAQGRLDPARSCLRETLSRYEK
ncbi:hypothetical protein N7457_003238 [Penicillium paradoxum]|uniref:uncharacterized protein n=1 Tax=Penicillium paradoxum TaxID=176176 RepID=UPI0025474DD6|nr:uncharacterized protein N7457_003238 [Penicillium paradoxum]KAJ5788248.1 hypothetical protein N7457_003238 [Penicillium paradoxum]